MAWTLAPCVRAALNEANDIWPGRNKASDGTIGDAAHSSRSSDHNPDPRGIVHAFDLTHDPNTGPDCHVLAERLRIRGDRRIKYVIWDRKIWNPSVSPKWRVYSGTNPHTKHMHVSVKSGETYENDVSPWWNGAPHQEDDMTPAQEAKLDGLIGRVEKIEAHLGTDYGPIGKALYKTVDGTPKEHLHLIDAVLAGIGKQLDEVKSAIATLQTGGFDIDAIAAKLADAALDAAANRLKD